jgi:hypothetical protein
MFKQTTLQNGNRSKTVWIPDKYAVVGKVLRLMQEDGWTVTGVYGSRTRREVHERGRDHLRTRQASDI